ncbi:NAD(P)-dependent oxidoreductase [Stackebrandtia soli]|uniref:NAD(P)-dependent oxidoreductase n=1 Tax=Stackebrandtia soli TaxID=1892856 RepID=UPI0039E9EA4C
MNTIREHVTMIGLGPMGQAMAAAFLDKGHPVTVWNRTASRAQPLVEAGATLAASPTDAIAAAKLIVLSLTDYDAMYAILGDHTAALAGRTVVNLSSDTPQRSREAAEWFAGHGARFVCGGVMVPAPLIGAEEAYVFYSGPSEAVDEHRDVLSVIGRVDYRGEDPGLAQLWYQSQLDVFLTMLSSFLHSAAMLATAGVSAAEAAPYATETLRLAADIIDMSVPAVDADDHADVGASTAMMGASADHILGASRELGIDTTLPEAVKTHYDRAIAAGHGASGWTSLYRTILRPPAE